MNDTPTTETDVQLAKQEPGTQPEEHSTDGQSTSRRGKQTITRRTVMKQLGAGVLGSLLAAEQVDAADLESDAGSGRWINEQTGAGYPDAEYGISVAIYEDPAVESHNRDRVAYIYEKFQYILDQLFGYRAIDGWLLTHYRTSKEATEAGNSKGGEFGAYDVKYMLQNEDWYTDPGHDVQVWLTPKAHEYVEVCRSPYRCQEDVRMWRYNEVRGGSGSFGAGTGWKATKPAASNKPNPKRVVAHGAAMELLHCLIDGNHETVRGLHDRNNEHYLGTLICEHNPDYGDEVGYYASPIAAGSETWNKGNCSTPVNRKNGITFTLSRCTKEAVKRTLRAHR